MRTLALICLALASSLAQAALNIEAVTARDTSLQVPGTRTITVRVSNAGNAPAVGDPVTFMTEACGTFQNGNPTIVVNADAQGRATVTLTAGPQPPLFCGVTASAGASIRINVIAYVLNEVVLTASSLAVPNPPLPGRGFTVEYSARVSSVMIPDATIAFSIVPGAVSASGILSDPVGTTGPDGKGQFNVFPNGIEGDFEVKLDLNGRTRSFPVRHGAVALLYQDMWWGGGLENGWGVSIVQHGDTIFAVLYIYDDQGRPTWYVLSGGNWDSAHRKYTGPIYSPRGSPFFAYDASRFTPGNPAGEVSITFDNASSGHIDYNINGRTGLKQISRQPIGQMKDTLKVNRGDMYWGGTSQNGWGVALLQQFETQFIVWFTYDANGLPTWFVLPAGTLAANGELQGRIYRTQGSAWIATEYRANQLVVTDVGPFRMRFDSAGVPTGMDWTIDARTGTLTLMRQGF